MTKNNREIVPANDGFSLISSQKLLTLYSTMLRCRSIAERLRGQRKNAGSVLGHEAAAVGVAIDLLPKDAVVSPLWPEAALKAINPSVPIAASIAAASRSAIGNEDGRGITVVFPRGRQGLQSAWLNALALAAGRKLPFLFLSLNGPDRLREIASGDAQPMKRNGHSLPLIAVDGNDVVAVYRVASEAIAHARKGNGPTLIDCRLSINGDPLQSMQQYLLGKGLQPPAQ
jgi:TPP-dependent pyruvate/acetoin dehydrogenase alpha subunit